MEGGRMNYIEFLDSKELLNSYNNKVVKLFNNVTMPNICWDEVLNFVALNRSKRVGKNMITSDYGFFYNGAQRISKVNSFVQEVHSRFGLGTDDDEVITCQLFGTTIVEEGSSLLKHSDAENNIFWQGKGKSRWRLYSSEEHEKPFMDIILEEGNLLYIPAHTVHLVESIGPRFGFATLFGERNINDNNR